MIDLKKEDRLTTLACSFDVLVHDGLSTAFGLVVRNRGVGESVDGAVPSYSAAPVA